MSKTTRKTKGRRKGRGNSLSTPVLLVLGGLVLVGGALFAVWKSGQDRSAGPRVPVEVNGSPSLRVDQELIDLGDVPLDKTVTVSFQLTNVGDETLRFDQEPYIKVLEGC